MIFVVFFSHLMILQFDFNVLYVASLPFDMLSKTTFICKVQVTLTG